MRVSILAGVCVATAAPAAAQVPTFPVSDLALAKQVVDPAMLDRLVAGLGAADFRVREKSGADLLALGDRALPQFKYALGQTKDYEVSRRLGGIVRQLENDRLAGSRKVTLKVQKVLAKDALKEIARQSGYRFQLDQLDGHKEAKACYSFDLTDVPFWQAVDVVCNAAGLDVNVNDDGGALQFTFSDCYNPMTAYAGPFRFVAQNVSTGKTLNLARLPRKELWTPAPEYLSLGIGLYAEPKAQVVGVKGTQLVKAVDNLGNVVTAETTPPQQMQSFYYGFGYRSYGQMLNLSLTRPAKDSTHLKELRARAQIVLLAETRPEVTVRDVLTVKNKKFVGRSTEVEVTQCEDNNGTVTLALTFRQLGTEAANDYTWANSIAQRVELSDAAGVKYQQNGWNNSNFSPASFSVVMTYISPTGGVKAGPPATFTLLEWVTSTQDVEYVFKDVILP
jgi:hypothetical protein